MSKSLTIVLWTISVVLQITFTLDPIHFTSLGIWAGVLIHIVILILILSTGQDDKNEYFSDVHMLWNQMRINIKTRPTLSTEEVLLHIMQDMMSLQHILEKYQIGAVNISSTIKSMDLKYDSIIGMIERGEDTSVEYNEYLERHNKMYRQIRKIYEDNLSTKRYRRIYYSS